LPAEVRIITEAALDAFAKGSDLPAENKNWLVVYLLGSHKRFDPENDAIVLANPQKPTPYMIPPGWEHPDPVIRAKLAEIKRLDREIRDAIPIAS
jgi:hypothetical protein